MAPIVYFLGGVLVRATTKAIRDRLIAQGFRKATKGQIDSKIPTVTGTENNLISLITRAKNAIKSESPVASSGRNTPRRTNKLGGSGQSEIGRKLGSRRMANFGKVRGGKGRAEAMAKPAPLKLTNAQRVFKPSAKSSEVTGNRSGSTPTIVAIAPSASSADEASSKIPSVQTKARKTSTQVQRSANADTAAKRRDNLKKPTKERNLENKRGFKPETKKEIKKEPVRPKLRPKVVEAKPMSLRSYLNAEIKSRKSTVAKEKAKARKGDYKSIAEAKKAKSLYYIKDGKPMAAVYKRDLKGL